MIKENARRIVQMRLLLNALLHDDTSDIHLRVSNHPSAEGMIMIHTHRRWRARRRMLVIEEAVESQGYRTARAGRRSLMVMKKDDGR